MDIRFEDLPTLEGAARRGRREAADPSIADAYPLTRADGGISSMSVAVGLRAVNLLRDRMYPSAGDIVTYGGAAQASYNTHFDCAHFQYNGTCNEACFGFEAHHMDPFYCATCEEQAADPANNPPWFWHFTGSRGNIQYIDMEPDACAGRDAWKWEVANCGNCADLAVFRCHDGFKKYPDSASWDPTICQALVSCDGQLQQCP